MCCVHRAVSGKCGGNTDPAEDVDCSGGDGTNAAKTHNRGPMAEGTTAAECCVYPGGCRGAGGWRMRRGWLGGESATHTEL